MHPNVYIVLGHYDYEGDTILGVFHDQTAAKQFLVGYDMTKRLFHSVRLEGWNDGGHQGVVTDRYR